MDVFDYIEKELDRIEVGYTSYDGTRLTMSIDDVRELIKNLRKKLAQNLHNACTDPIEREDVINILHDAMQGRSESEENLIGEIVSKVDLLPSAQPKEHTDERTKTHACDCISREAAIDIVVFECGKWTGLAKEISKQLKQLQSTQPERKKGKWIVYKAPDKYHCGLCKCPFCGEEMIAESDEYNYCPNCGVRMQEGEDE